MNNQYNFEEYTETEDFLKSLAADYLAEEGEALLREQQELEQATIEDEAELASLARLDEKMQNTFRQLEKQQKPKWRRDIIIGLSAIAASLLIVVLSSTYFLSLLRNNTLMPADRATGMADATITSPVPAPPMYDIDGALAASPPLLGGGAINNAWGADQSPSYGIVAEPEAEPNRQTEETRLRGREIVLASIFAPAGWEISYTDHDGDLLIFHLKSHTGSTVVVLAGAPIYDPQYGAFHEIFINHQPAYMLVESTHSILFFDISGLQLILSTAYDHTDLIELAENWI